MPRYKLQIDPDPDPTWGIVLAVLLLAVLYPIARFVGALAILAALVWITYHAINWLTTFFASKDHDDESKR